MINQSMMGIGEAGVAGGNDAVRLWDGVSMANDTPLIGNHPTSNTSVLSTYGTMAFWLKNESTTPFIISTQQSQADQRGFRIEVGNSGVTFRASDTSDTAFLSSSFGTSNFLNAWTHYYMSWVAMSAGNPINPPDAFFELAVNGSFIGQFAGANNNPYSLFQRTPFAINYGYPDTQDYAPASIYDFFIDTTRYTAANSANVQKFINGGLPVDLGTDGSTPFGYSPPVFLSGAKSGWLTNKGTLNVNSTGIFTVNNAANFTLSPTTP